MREQSGSGYLLIYREDNEEDEMCVETWLTEGAKVRCSLVLGNGKKTMVVTVVRQRGNKIFFG